MGHFDYLWKKHGGFLTKTGVSPNSYTGKWYGFDVYTTVGFRPVYEAPKFCLEAHYPELYEQLMDTVPHNTKGIRFVSALGDFHAHADNFMPSWQLRCMFKCEDVSEQWYYTRMDGTDERPLVLPDDSPWWMYRDGALKHGTRYTPGKEKILIQIFGHGLQFQALAAEGIAHFDPKYQVRYD